MTRWLIAQWAVSLSYWFVCLLKSSRCAFNRILFCDYRPATAVECVRFSLIIIVIADWIPHIILFLSWLIWFYSRTNSRQQSHHTHTYSIVWRPNAQRGFAVGFPPLGTSASRKRCQNKLLFSKIINELYSTIGFCCSAANGQGRAGHRRGVCLSQIYSNSWYTE